MPTQDTLLAQGIAAAKAGDAEVARSLLTLAVRLQPDSAPAWLWLSSVLKTPQGRIYCLRRVLDLDPENRPAQRGLAALQRAEPGPAIVAVAAPAAAVSAAAVPAAGIPVPATPGRRREAVGRPARRLHPARLLVKPRFWQAVVALLGMIALAMAGLLAYATLARPGNADDGALVAAIAPLITPSPAGTLRPTFTTTPTDTPLPTDTPTPTETPSPTPTLTPLPTDTPLPTNTAVPVATATRRPRRQAPTATPTSAPAPAPQAALPARALDPRFPSLGVRVEPASVAPGQCYWRLVEARWADGQESGGKHSVFVEVENLNGGRAVGQPVVFSWADGSVTLPIEDRPPPDWGVDFGMYNTLGSYSVCVGGGPSDRIVGLGLGTAEAPNFTIHTSFYLTFRLVRR